MLNLVEIRKPRRPNFFTYFVLLVACFATGVSVAAVLKPPTLVITEPKLVESITVGDAHKLAREILTPKAFACLNKLFTLESNWRPAALNTSGALGIGQLLPTTWVNIGLKPTSDGRAQLVASLAYIAERYGSAGACGALTHEHKEGWY